MPLIPNSSGGSSGLPSAIDILVVSSSRNLLATDVGKLLTTTANITLTLDETEAIPANSVIYVLAVGAGTIAFDVASTEDFEGVATVLVGGQQAELVFEAEYSAYLVRRSVDGTAINPSSIGDTTQGASSFTTTTVYESNVSGSNYSKAVFTATGITRSAAGAGDTNQTFTVSSGNGPLDLLSAANLELRVGNDLKVRLSGAGTSTLELTSAGVFNLYGTNTSSTVYERLSSQYDSGSGAFVIGTEKGASGGSARPLSFAVNGTVRATFATGGNLSLTNLLGSTGGAFGTGVGDVPIDPAFGALGQMTLWSAGTQRGSFVSGYGVVLDSGSLVRFTSTANSQGTVDSGFSRLSAGIIAAGNGSASDYSGFVQDLYRRMGSGTPEAAVTAPVGAVYHRTDGGAGTSFYVKESGSGNTGWVAK